MTDGKPPDRDLPRGSISIGASIPALEALARSSWPRMPSSVKNGEHDNQFLFDVSINAENADIDQESLERQISWYLESKNSADVRRRVRKSRNTKRYEENG